MFDVMFDGKAGRCTYNDSARPSLGVTMLPQTLLHARENTRRQRHIEQTILLFLPRPQLLKSPPKSVKRLFTSLVPGYVGASLAELLQLLRKTRTLELDRRLDDREEVVMGHLVRGKAYDLEVVGEETSSFLKSYQAC